MPHVPYHYTPYKMRTSLICLAWAGSPGYTPCDLLKGGGVRPSCCEDPHAV